MANTSTPSAPLQTITDFPDTPRGKAEFWQVEIDTAQKRLQKWHTSGDKIVKRFLDDRQNSQRAGVQFRLNLFSSNIKTQMSMLYGNLPQVDVSRIDTSGNDDPGRVAAELMERLLRLDIEENGEEYDSVLTAILQDRLLPGLGCARVRYEMEETEITSGVLDFETGQPPEGEVTQTELLWEAAPVDYYFWRDVLWGWGRTFSELPWIAFRSYLTQDEVRDRFGDYHADNVHYSQQEVGDKESANDPDMGSAWQKAEIWEIWDKDSRQVYWWSKGCSKILDQKEDPLQLSGFFPCPPFFLANPTTSLYMPTPDFHLSQDLYNEIDKIQTRISIITEAVKVVGVYDKGSDGVQRMFNEGVDNTLIPVDNWALFAERGGIRGQVDWFPIQDVVATLDQLRNVRDETIGLLQQVSGMADIMRGGLDNQYEGVGQSQIKAKFGSSRMQALQEQFARFFSDLMQIKAEVIARHFDPLTIAEQSGAEFSRDREMIPAAIQLIKNPDKFKLRVSIKPEQLAQMDYAQLREERGAYLNGLATFLQSASPLIQQDPRSTPFLLEMLKWGMAGFKGSSEIEGVLDKAIEQMQQPQEQQGQEKPDPEQIRAQTQIQLEQIRMQAKQQELQFKAQSDAQLREQDKMADIATRQAEMRFEMQKQAQQAEIEAQMMAAKMQADVQTELLTSQINAEQNQAAVQGEIQKELIKQAGEIAKIELKTSADMSIAEYETKVDAAMKMAELTDPEEEISAKMDSESNDG